jgi:hypothetical protein
MVMTTKANVRHDAGSGFQPLGATMDTSTFRHRVALAPHDVRDFHVFIRSDDGNVEHFWPGEDQMFGPEHLGGHFDTDPVAVWHSSGLHLIGRSGSRLVDWVWGSAREGKWLGQPTELTLPGFAVADPEVIAVDGKVHVFAPSLDGPMRHWSLSSPESGWEFPEVMTGEAADHSTRACAVSRMAGRFDVFALDNQRNGLRHWFNDDDGWHSERRTRSPAGENLVGRPAALAMTENRLDVFAVRNDGVPVHWGWDGRTWFADEVRLGAPGVVPGDLTLINPSGTHLSFWARARGPGGDINLVSWSLDPEHGEWRGPHEESLSPFPGNAWLTGRDVDIQPESMGQMALLTRNPDGSFVHHVLVLTDRHSIDGRPVWENEEERFLVREEPPVPAAGFDPVAVNPELLARRPEDLVLLGVRWNDAVEVLPGQPGELLAHAGARLAVTLPPQHVAEEVVSGDGPAVPPIDPQFTGGVPLWRSAAAGPSRVVVALDEGTRWPLTVEGVLDALHGGTLAPAADLTDGGTMLELPYRLLMTPFRPDGGAITLDHSTTTARGPGGSVGLWSTRIAAAGAGPTASAALTLRPLGASGEDQWRTSLGAGTRGRILVEEPSARIDRLRLSSLGASFAIAGSWETFAWDHAATLGRDSTVRTATQGVLYPFGHRAVYVETTERRLHTTAEGAIALLRKHAVLLVSEAVRQLPPSRAFPFITVRVQRTTVELNADPRWTRKEFDPPATLDLQRMELDKAFEATLLRPAIDSGGVGAIPVEDLAFIDGLTIPEAARASNEYVDIWVNIMRIRDKIAALEAGGAASVDVFFVPEDAGGPIRFPVELSGRSADVHVDLPMVFVADIRMDDGLLHPPFSSLADPEVLQQVQAAYRLVGDGDVTISPARIDMVGAAESKPTDTPEVRRLHVVGESRAGGFAPRLGTAPNAGEGVPPEDRWAFEMVMTELSTLVGHQDASGVPVLRVALSPELLGEGPDPGLLFAAPAGTEALVTEFSRNSARSGGLVAPDLRIDAVARGHGPVRATTFADQVAGNAIDPGTFLDSSATILGFTLTDLIDGAQLPGTPEILSHDEPGRPPRVTMVWSQVPLRTSGSFLASDASRLDIEVTVSPDERKVRGTVENVVIAFPDADEETKLLEVHLDKIEFLQDRPGTPSIDVSGVRTTFFGFLKLLDDLQDAVKFAGGTPEIRASDRGVTATFNLPVPDVTTGGFQLTGLVFHGVIDVPFDDRPVTIGLAFASRDDPFNVSVLALGGGGYVDIVLDKTGLRRLEIALEFGASLELDFIVARGEVYVMGGIRVVDDGGLSLAGYLRLGGMVEVLGLVSVSVSLVVSLTYVKQRDAMVGRATLVLEIDLLLFSDSVELDSGEWVLGDEMRGSGPPLPPQPVVDLQPLLPRPDPLVLPDLELQPAIDPDAWRAYRAAFDTEAMA